MVEYACGTGKDLLTGTVLGYDVMIRLRMAVNPSHDHFWHVGIHLKNGHVLQESGIVQPHYCPNVDV
jgi:hypothetical protein